MAHQKWTLPGHYQQGVKPVVITRPNYEDNLTARELILSEGTNHPLLPSNYESRPRISLERNPFHQSDAGSIPHH